MDRRQVHSSKASPYWQVVNKGSRVRSTSTEALLFWLYIPIPNLCPNLHWEQQTPKPERLGTSPSKPDVCSQWTAVLLNTQGNTITIKMRFSKMKTPLCQFYLAVFNHWVMIWSSINQCSFLFLYFPAVGLDNTISFQILSSILNTLLIYVMPIESQNGDS